MLLGGAAMADPYSDPIGFGTPGQFISNSSYSYTHDISSLVGLSDTIDSATLTLTFGDDEQNDGAEDVTVYFNGNEGSWYLGDVVDYGNWQVGQSYGPQTINVGWLSNRTLGVNISVSGDVYLRSSTLAGEYTPYEDPGPVVPVPAAFVIGLLGLGTAGLKLRRFA
jgi:hypothetical protein